MDGAKSITDTVGIRNDCGRQALCMGRSNFAKSYGPCTNANPGGSRNLAQLESASPKGQGFLDNANQSRVSWS